MGNVAIQGHVNRRLIHKTDCRRNIPLSLGIPLDCTRRLVEALISLCLNNQSTKRKGANNMDIELSTETQDELNRLKQYFPFRIIFAAYIDGNFYTYATHTKRQMNNILRKGGLVWMVKSKGVQS